MGNENYSIYTLSDPETVRYVGLSKDVQKRFKQHIGRRTAQWIKDLLEQGIEPILNIIETNIPDFSTAKQQEQKWIYHFEGQGCSLENLIGNEATLRQRAEEEALHQRLYDEFVTRNPPEIIEKLIQMTLAGYETVGYCAWDSNFEAVRKTINLLEKRPGFGLHLTEIDAAKLTFNLFGYTWNDGSE